MIRLEKITQDNYTIIIIILAIVITLVLYKVSELFLYMANYGIIKIDWRSFL